MNAQLQPCIQYKQQAFDVTEDHGSRKLLMNLEAEEMLHMYDIFVDACNGLGMPVNRWHNTQWGQGLSRDPRKRRWNETIVANRKIDHSREGFKASVQEAYINVITPDPDAKGMMIAAFEHQHMTKTMEVSERDHFSRIDTVLDCIDMLPGDSNNNLIEQQRKRMFFKANPRPWQDAYIDTAVSFTREVTIQLQIRDYVTRMKGNAHRTKKEKEKKNRQGCGFGGGFSQGNGGQGSGGRGNDGRRGENAEDTQMETTLGSIVPPIVGFSSGTNTHDNIPSLRAKEKKRASRASGFGRAPDQNLRTAHQADPERFPIIGVINGQQELQVNGNMIQILNNVRTIDPPVTNLVAEIVKINNKSSQHVANQFANGWLARYPRPNQCVHNNGGKFLGHEFQTLLMQNGNKSVPMTVKNPQSNAICEQLH
eukprot:jgi/Psemu1/12068/gm1.12068_g